VEREIADFSQAKRNRPPDEEEAGHLTKLVLVLEMEPHTRAHQVLPQIAIVIGIDLGARIVQELVFNKGAELRSPIVICAGNNLPREVRVTFPSATAEVATGSVELGTRGFRKVNAYPRPGIGLESSKRESSDEVSHKRASVNPGSQARVSR